MPKVSSAAPLSVPLVTLPVTYSIEAARYCLWWVVGGAELGPGAFPVGPHFSL